MSDPQIAALAQRLMSRLELDASLGVQNVQTPRLDKAELTALAPGSARASGTVANPWENGGAAPAGMHQAITPAPVAKLAAPPAFPAPEAPVLPASAPRAPEGLRVAVPETDREASRDRVLHNLPGQAAAASAEPVHLGSPGKIAALAPVVAEALTCTKCGLCAGRTHVVFGDGSLDAKIMFIGEAPGREEDLQGHPFVGRAGKLLTDIIEKGMKLSREDVYITNPVKCRPPGNRVPKPDEVAHCMPYLDRQIETIRPKAIVAVGRTAAGILTGEDLAIGKMRGRWFEYKGIPLMPIYHTAYLLRQREEQGRGNPADKLTWQDIQSVMKRVAELG